jgi:hypothetical protein
MLSPYSPRFICCSLKVYTATRCRTTIEITEIDVRTNNGTIGLPMTNIAFVLKVIFFRF